MSKQANKTVIGIFVVGAIALVIAAILILGSGKLFRPTFKAVCYFEGSVGGLNVGAPVVLRGVKIGSVKDIVLRADSTKLTFTIPVYIEMEPDKFRVIGPRPKKLGENLKTFIDNGLRAQLEMQSIVTGQMQVGLDYYPNKPAKFVGADTETPEIPTIPTPMQELAQKIQKIPLDEIFQKILSAVEGIEKVVNSPELIATIRSINQAANEIQPLASNLGDTVKDIRKLVQNVDGQVGPLASNLNETVLDIRKLVKNADVSVAGISSSLDETVKEARGVIRNVDSRIDSLAASIEGPLKSAEATMVVAQKAIEKIEGTVGENSPLVYELNKTLEETRALARSVRVLADYLDRHPESVIWGK
jgi:paraquat-inducible protein B